MILYSCATISTTIKESNRTKSNRYVVVSNYHRIVITNVNNIKMPIHNWKVFVELPINIFSYFRM